MGRWQSGQLHLTVNQATSVYGGSNPSRPTPYFGTAVVAQLVEHFHGKEGVSGSNPDNGSGTIIIIQINFMTRENLAKMKCEVCKSINYYSTRNKKKIKEKLEMKKHCPKCGKHTIHKEMK